MKWTDTKEKIKLVHAEELVFVGQLGVAGVIDGKLPNGDKYEWTKVNRRRLKKPKNAS